MLKKILSLYMVLFPLVLFSQHITDTIHIKEITVHGERIFKKENAGVKITRIDSMVMQDKITVSLSELLSQNTTVFIKDHGRGALATASFRGTAPSHTQVYWNGLTINSPMLGMTDFSLIPSFIVDNMQLEHGSASLGAGSGGLGGSIAIENMPAWNNRFNVSYRQSVGSYGTFGEFFQFGIGNRKFQSKTRLYADDSRNDYQYVNKAILERPFVKNDNADFHKKGLLQEFYYRLTEKNILSLKAWAQVSDRSLPSVMSYEGDDRSNKNEQQDSTLKVVLDWNSYFKYFKIDARTGVDIQNTNYSLSNFIHGVGMFPAINSSGKSFAWNNHFGIESTAVKRFSWKTSFDVVNYNVHSFEAVDQVGYDKVRTDLSAFGGIYYQATNWMNLSLMLRNQVIERNLSPLMFNVGVSVQPFAKKEFILKANVSRNYHFPSLNDLYWQPGGNPDLIEEESKTAETSVLYQLHTNNFRCEQELTSYYSDITNWIIWLPSFQGYWQPFNLKKVKSYGIEYHLKLIQKIHDFEFQLHGNYAYTKSLNFGDRFFLGDGSYGKQLPFLPLHSGNILFSASYKGYYLRFQNNSYGERFTLSSNQIGVSDDSEEIGASVSTSRLNWYYPYFMNNLTVGKELKIKSLSMGLDFKVNNLFNEEYRSVLGRYMPRRNYEVLLKIAFAQ